MSQLAPVKPETTIVLAPESETSVVIGGVNYELNGIKKAKTDELYAALGGVTTLDGKPTHYQEMADAISKVVLDYQSVVSITPPDGMTVAQALTALSSGLKDGADKFLATASEPMKKFYEATKKVPVLGGLLNTGEGIVTLGSIGVALGSGFIDGVKLPSTLYDKTKTGIKSAANYIDGQLNPYTPEQAQAIGTVFAAAQYAAIDAPLASGTSQRPEADFLDKCKARVQQFWHWLPESVTVFLSTVGNWFGNGFDWAKASEEAKKDAADYAAHPLTYEERVDQYAAAKVQPQARAFASAILDKVEEVDGRPTKNLSTLVKDGGTYLDNNGNLKTLTFNSQTGMPEPKDVIPAGNKDKPWTATDYAKGTGMVAGAAVSADIAHGAAKGFAGKLVGDNSLHSNINKKYTKLETDATDAGIKAQKAGKTAESLKQFEKAENYEKIAKKSAEIAAERELEVGAKVTSFAEKGAAKGWYHAGDKLGYKLGQAGGYLTEKSGNAIAKIGGKATAPLVTLGEKAFVKFGAETISKAIPIVGEAYMAKDDLADGYNGIKEGDGNKVVHASTSIAGGLAGGLAGGEAGTALGAGVGVWFGGIGAVPGALIGGIIGSVGGFIGGQWGGGKLGDAIAADSNSEKQNSNAPALEMDAGLAEILKNKDMQNAIQHNPQAAALIAKMYKTATTDMNAKEHLKAANDLATMCGYRLAINGTKVTIGALASDVAAGNLPKAPLGVPMQQVINGMS